MLYQSLIVNTFYYGGAFILYQNGWFVPNLNSIAVMFGVGITIDAAITFLLYSLHRKKERQPDIQETTLLQA
ncbi:hypothetical protein [Photobacterium sp. J15]|uniref:hypothetical protein n=1 Tax=Photobacterium sp. J15 TaxID=265901 RepID=UPI000A4362E4|nr:hypothetical protein [Photobacterium sp. J15]